LSVDAAVKHLAKFASDIWQIHPFGDGKVTLRYQQNVA
jgi:fido (protein-threonine AMPylation protein)